MNEEQQEMNPAQALKLALGKATFSDSMEIGGIVYKLLDSLSDDLIFQDVSFSERTEDFTQELVDCLAEDISEFASDDLDEEENDDEEDEEEEEEGIVDSEDEEEDEDSFEDDDLTDEEEDNFVEDSAEEDEEDAGPPAANVVEAQVQGGSLGSGDREGATK